MEDLDCISLLHLGCSSYHTFRKQSSFVCLQRPSIMKAVDVPMREIAGSGDARTHSPSFQYPCSWVNKQEAEKDQFGRPFTPPTHDERHLNDNIPDLLEMQDPANKHHHHHHHHDRNYHKLHREGHAKTDEPNKLLNLGDIETVVHKPDSSADKKVPKKQDKKKTETEGEEDGEEEETLLQEAINLLWEEKVTIFFFAVILALLLLMRYQTSWGDLDDDAWFTIWTLFIAMAALVRGTTEPDIALFGCCTLLMYRGIIEPAQAFDDLGNDTVITIALMIVVANGIEESGAIEYMAKYCMGRPWNVYTSQFRFMIVNGFISAWTNNTPQVAVFIPVVEAWCLRYGLPTSKYMIPLSYATILGGLITIIGTSTNLVVKALAQSKYPNMSMPFFEIGAIGAPLTIAGIIYVTLASPFLLPNRQGVRATLNEFTREYTVHVIVRSGSDMVGHSIEKNNLKHLPALYLVDIERKSGEVIPAPSGDVIIEAGDKICFVGAVDGARYLWKSNDFVPSFDGSIGISGNRVLVEAVVNVRSQLVGKTVRTSRFRSEFGAAILSVHRGGERLKGRVGDFVLRHGDTLLLEAPVTFAEEYRHDSTFALVAEVVHSYTTSGARWKMQASFVLLLTLVILNAQSSINIQLTNTALACVYAYFMLGISNPTSAKRSVPDSTLLTIAGGDGIATAMTKTGIANKLAMNLVHGFAGLGTVGPLYGIYIGTVILTALLSNSASATLMFAVAAEASSFTGIHAKAFMYILALAASADFSTPIGYQTNLMVAGPGGYKFLDYTKIGLPLQIVCCLVSVPLSYHFFGQ